MTLINHNLIIDCLSELSCEKRQRQLWLSDGRSEEWSSLTEAYLGLFDDSGLSHKLDSEGTEFGKEVDSSLRRLEEVVTKIDDDRSPEKVMTDTQMEKVRDIASSVLDQILSIGARNGERIVHRLLELCDEDRQRRLWLLANPRSSLEEVYWHLFTGDDYWGYLDFGEQKRELSSMFSQLEELVGNLEPYRVRLPIEFITDPKMGIVREMASRIIRKLERLGVSIPPP